MIIDFETQSACNLTKVGSKRYLRDPTTRLLCLVAKRDNLIVVWVPEGRAPKGVALHPRDCWPEGVQKCAGVMLCTDCGPPSQLLEWVDSGATFVAHNAVFDSEAWRELVSAPYGCSEPAAWLDTLPLARAKGYPGSLDALGEIFMGTGKDKEGKRVLKLMYTATTRNGSIQYPVGTAHVWKSLLQYNVKDVLLGEQVYQRVVGESVESDLLDSHCEINARGIYFDLPFLSNLRNLWEDLESAAFADIARLTDGKLTQETIKSPQKVKRWLTEQGVRMESLKKSDVERLFEFPEEFFTCDDDTPIEARHELVSEVLRLRQSVTRVSKGKLERVTAMADDDGRVRDVLAVYGAHTGRFSSRGIQLHNMARGVGDLSIESLLELSRKGRMTLAAVMDAAALCKKTPRADDVLSTLLRPVFCAAPGHTLCIADFAAIECRGVAWLSDEECLLQQFARGEDVYCAMASRIFGRPITKADKDERNIGKVTVLGCGYSMGVPKFIAYCKANRIDLAAAGTTAEACVEAFRDAYQSIAGRLEGKFRKGGLWQKYGAAAKRAVEKGVPQFAGKCCFAMSEGDLIIRLPSGRELRYRNARVELAVPRYAKLLGIDCQPRPTIVYAHHHGYDAELYGGLITENICQAACRDILCQTCIIPFRHDLVLHVHDEGVREVPAADAESALSTMARTMTTAPAWAAGFPIGVEGYTCPHYTKSPFRDSWCVEARNGEILKFHRGK